MDEMDRSIILNLFKCGVVRIGNFKLKSGFFSPIYIDLRRIISYPSVVKDLAIAVRSKQTELQLQTDFVCGVPYTALPIASVFSASFDVPMVMKRKESKDYGTKRFIEGVFNQGDSCLIIEDIVSSGTSIVETAEALRKEGLDVQHCIVIINRKQGGLENAKKIGVNIYPLFDIDTVVEVYNSVNNVEPQLLQKIFTYFKENSYYPVVRPDCNLTVSYAERAKTTVHALAKRLYNIMEDKKTNLCVAVDTISSSELLELAEKLGPHICVLKTHIDILSDFSEDVIMKLQQMASTHDFLIFEDRKFADIGNTVLNQYQKGMYKIREWADIVTVHGIAGECIIKALKAVENVENKACLLVAEMSSEGALTSDDYKESIFKMAEKHIDFVIGYIAQERNPNSKALIHFCPGVNIGSSSDSLGQQYNVPEIAVENGADVIIVGRGICKAPDILAAVTEYKTRGFNAYLKRIS